MKRYHPSVGYLHYINELNVSLWLTFVSATAIVQIVSKNVKRYVDKEEKPIYFKYIIVSQN